MITYFIALDTKVKSGTLKNGTTMCDFGDKLLIHMLTNLPQVLWEFITKDQEKL